MPALQSQIWKGSAFCIDRLEGKTPRTVIFRFTGPFTARDMFSSVAPTAFHHIFDCELTAADAAPITNIFDLTAVPYMDSSGIGMLVMNYVLCRGKGPSVSSPPEPTRASLNSSSSLRSTHFISHGRHPRRRPKPTPTDF